jgi:ferredoxin-NADP reductase
VHKLLRLSLLWLYREAVILSFKAAGMRFIIRQIIQEAPDAKRFLLEDVSGEPLAYEAGQFLIFIFHNRNGAEQRRNYSICGSPALQEPLQILVKRVPNGEYSRWWIDKAAVGDTVESIGASGFFRLPESGSFVNNYFFFAAGSGISPVYALIKTLLVTTHARIVLVYSNRSKRETIFYDAFNQWKERYPDRFTIHFFFSDSNNVNRKRLGSELLHELLHEHEEYLDIHTLFYLCGPFEYMRMISIVLLSRGFRHDQIRKEQFVIEKAVPKQLPPDTDRHMVRIEKDGIVHLLEVQYPDTILSRARGAGVSLPYSCESGQCGTCAVQCISGKVWMSRNDVLLDEEIAAGRVLTCTGYPVGGDVALKFT